jgi:dienelactone hydrolase
MTTVTDIEYQADGTTMIGRRAVPGGEGRRPAVLITHESRRADQLAELGYAAFALDYQGAGCR